MARTQTLPVNRRGAHSLQYVFARNRSLCGSGARTVEVCGYAVTVEALPVDAAAPVLPAARAALTAACAAAAASTAAAA